MAFNHLGIASHYTIPSLEVKVNLVDKQLILLSVFKCPPREMFVEYLGRAVCLSETWLNMYR